MFFTTKINPMNDLSIKDLRTKKGLSQADLAKKIGVSRQTIINYEKGEVIPESKKDLLYNILQSEEEKPNTKNVNYYTQNLTGYAKKILEKEEEIKARLETVKLLKEKKQDPTHQLNIISILKTQISIIKEAENNHDVDL